MPWRTIASLLAVAWLSGCSFILSWDPNNLPCGGVQEACVGGYSCRPQNGNQLVCVKDHTLNLGDTCQLDRQCPVGSVCPHPGLDLCAAACAPNTIYTSLSSCPVGFYCGPFNSLGRFSNGGTYDPEFIAACASAAACTPGTTCSTAALQGGVCVQVGDKTNACLAGCNITWTNSAYADNCGLDDHNHKQFCQPVGTPNQQQLVCIDSPPERQQAPDTPCANPVSQPCASGQGCINGQCHHYCQPEAFGTPGQQANCPTQFRCCSIPGLASGIPPLGYCVNGSGCP